MNDISKDKFGRRFNSSGLRYCDLDSMKSRIALLDFDLIDSLDSYSISSLSGIPLCGRVSNDITIDMKYFVHQEFL